MSGPFFPFLTSGGRSTHPKSGSGPPVAVPPSSRSKPAIFPVSGLQVFLHCTAHRSSAAFRGHGSVLTPRAMAKTVAIRPDGEEQRVLGVRSLLSVLKQIGFMTLFD